MLKNLADRSLIDKLLPWLIHSTGQKLIYEILNQKIDDACKTHLQCNCLQIIECCRNSAEEKIITFLLP